MLAELVRGGGYLNRTFPKTLAGIGDITPDGILSPADVVSMKVLHPRQHPL